MNFALKAFSQEDFMSLVQLGAYVPFGKPNKWVVDESTDTRLVCWGGQGSSPDRENSPPDHYLLAIHGHLIPFRTWKRQLVQGKNATYTFEVVDINAPKEIPEEELKEVLREGLATFWGGLTGKNIVAVDLVMPQEGSRK